VSRLVVVVPLVPGTRGRVEELLAQGPPFDYEDTHLARHDVFLTDHEAIFDFETPGDEPPLDLRAEDPALLAAAEAWDEIRAGNPRKARLAYSWKRNT
jgi:hypothetical protein